MFSTIVVTASFVMVMSLGHATSRRLPRGWKRDPTRLDRMPLSFGKRDHPLIVADITEPRPNSYLDSSRDIGNINYDLDRSNFLENRKFMNSINYLGDSPLVLKSLESGLSSLVTVPQRFGKRGKTTWRRRHSRAKNMAEWAMGNKRLAVLDRMPVSYGKRQSSDLSLSKKLSVTKDMSVSSKRQLSGILSLHRKRPMTKSVPLFNATPFRNLNFSTDSYKETGLNDMTRDGIITYKGGPISQSNFGNKASKGQKKNNANDISRALHKNIQSYLFKKGESSKVNDDQSSMLVNYGFLESDQPLESHEEEAFDVDPTNTQGNVHDGMSVAFSPQLKNALPKEQTDKEVTVSGKRSSLSVRITEHPEKHESSAHTRNRYADFDHNPRLQNMQTKVNQDTIQPFDSDLSSKLTFRSNIPKSVRRSHFNSRSSAREQERSSLDFIDGNPFTWAEQQLKLSLHGLHMARKSGDILKGILEVLTRKHEMDQLSPY